MRLQADVDGERSQPVESIKRPRFVPGSVKIIVTEQPLPLRPLPFRYEGGKIIRENLK